MFSALLLPLVLAGAPAGPVVAPTDDPPIQIWINNDRRFFSGDRAKVQVRTQEDGYLIVLHSDPDGHLRVLFPLDPKDDNFVRGGRKYEIRGRGGRESFAVDVSSGRGMVYAAVSRDPFRFDDYVLDDHWDYRKLAPQRLPKEPEPELTDLVRQMGQGSFDYDVLSYDVVGRPNYASNSYSYYDNYYDPFYYNSYDPWCYGYYGCGRYGSSLSVSLFFGSRYPRYYYRPYRYAYDPFYDPFFYDPFYYQPVYLYPVRPYYYRAPYRYSYSRYHYYNDPRFGYFGNRYTPYRGRGFDAPYRDRRYDLGRSVNTVYLPPNTRVVHPVSSSPLRRNVGRGSLDAAGGVDVRRPEATRDAAQARGRSERRRPQGEERAAPNRAQARSVAERGPVEARRARPAKRTGEVTRVNDSERLPVDVSPRRAESQRLPVDVSPRRAAEPERLPVDVTPRRAEVVRPNVEREPVEAREARPARREEGDSRDAPQIDTWSRDRGGSDRDVRVERGGSGGGGGGERVERSAPPPSRSYDGGGGGGGGRRGSDGGGGGSGGSGGGGSGGGGRRR